MHAAPQCARLCRKEGGGGVCAAWTFCWDQRRCNLLSRLPSSLQPAKPTNPNPLANSNRTLNTYNAKCASGFSQSACLMRDMGLGQGRSLMLGQLLR